MPIRRVKKALTERIRLQRLKREHEKYLEKSAPAQFKEVLGSHNPEITRQIEDMARALQPRRVQSIIRFEYSDEEIQQINELKQKIAEIWRKMDDESRKRLLAAALHMRGHGPPYEDLARHVIDIYNKNRTEQ